MAADLDALFADRSAWPQVGWDRAPVSLAPAALLTPFWAHPHDPLDGVRYTFADRAVLYVDAAGPPPCIRSWQAFVDMDELPLQGMLDYRRRRSHALRRPRVRYGRA